MNVTLPSASTSAVITTVEPRFIDVVEREIEIDAGVPTIVRVTNDEAMLRFPERSVTAPKGTFKVREPRVADAGDKMIWYLELESEIALPLANPVAVPPRVRSVELKPVTASEKVIVTVMGVDIVVVAGEVVNDTVGAVVSGVGVVKLRMDPDVVPCALLAFNRK